MSTENTDNTKDLGLSDRGVGVQAAGFAVIGCVSVALLQVYAESDYWLYLWLETSVTRLYWAFVVPLAALFDWGRIMFAKGKAIREAKKAEVLAKIEAKIEAQVREQSLKQERRRVETVLSRHGVMLSKEVENELFGDSRSD